jgi:outer membrane lipoprotein-sorting protein
MMKSNSSEVRFCSNNFRTVACARRLPALLILVLALLGSPLDARAQKSRAQKLPSPDKIVSDYLKAVGGKKRLGAVRDATYEWSVQQGVNGAKGTARTFTKFPASTRTDIILERGETNTAVNARSAWLRRDGGELRTLTDTDADVAKLLSALDASRLVNYKKQDVLARTVEFSDGGNYLEPAYVVEFSRRNGARLSYWFGANSKLPVQVADNSRELSIRYKDYRAAQNGLLEPHRVEIRTRDAETLALTLNSMRYNTGLDDSLFEPPGDQSLNISELLRAVARNQREIDQRVSDYTFTRTETEREIDDKGVVKKEKTIVREVYPVAGGGSVLKLISEDGAPLSPERAAKEERRVAEALGKIETGNAKRKEKRERERAERTRKQGEDGGSDADDNVGVGVFLRACEFVSPRRERFRNRDAIVFDFRPRPNFKPANRGESFVAKLAGVAWIDPVDKQVMRLEARLAEGFKVGGGLLASVRPGSAVVLEQTRLEEGVWLPRFEQINASAKLFLFAGFRLDAIREYSNYRRFSTNVGDAKVESPPQPSPTPPDEP